VAKLDSWSWPISQHIYERYDQGIYPRSIISASRNESKDIIVTGRHKGRSKKSQQSDDSRTNLRDNENKESSDTSTNQQDLIESALSTAHLNCAYLDVSALETWLLEAACTIRGATDAPKFKGFILPLIFFRRLSDVFDDEFGGT